MSERGYTVGEVARMAHVTVRALHHWDALGLLVPSERGENGYRRYLGPDLDRLHELLVLRELGFGLEEVARLLDAGAEVRRKALEARRVRLVEESRRTRSVIRAVDAALAALRGDTEMSEKRFEGFEDFDHAKYAEEAERRWGETEAYRESARRTKRYGKAEWAEIRAEGDEILAAFAALHAEGAAPDGAEAMEVAERHRGHISRWFYSCSRELHAALGEMYVADPRFTAFYERHGEGLAAFVRAAVQANAAREAP